MRGINEENCDPQAVRKARVRARVTARGSRVRGGQREVAKREMRSEIQRRRGRTSLCVCACEGEVHPSCGFPYQTDVHPFRERGGCGGRRAIYYLGGFQKCLLFSKAEVFRVKTVPALLFSTAPQISCTLTCTLFFFFGGGGWHPSTWLASWERPALCGSHQVFVLQRPLRVNDL